MVSTGCDELPIFVAKAHLKRNRPGPLTRSFQGTSLGPELELSFRTLRRAGFLGHCSARLPKTVPRLEKVYNRSWKGSQNLLKSENPKRKGETRKKGRKPMRNAGDLGNLIDLCTGPLGLLVALPIASTGRRLRWHATGFSGHRDAGS